MSVTILTGDCREMLDTLPAGSAQTCVTSPPYFGLRDYGHEGQIGLERSVDEYVDALVSVFRAVRRVLADDGTLWLNLGDSYVASATGAAGKGGQLMTGGRKTQNVASSRPDKSKVGDGLKTKDLIGIPWRVAFALQQDGWYLRSDIVWHKPNPMPESVTDRPTKAHEYLFLLTKAPRYYYDAAAIAERVTTENWKPATGANKNDTSVTLRHDAARHGGGQLGNHDSRNKRSVWTVSTAPYSGAHFATFPPKLIEPCILAGSREGDTVVDPFGGAGTTGLVADRLNRDAVLVELNPEYAQMARDRIYNDAPLFASVGGV